MTFLTFSLTRRPVFTGEYDANDEPICRKPITTVHINAATIVSIDIRDYSDHTDLIIKTTDGETWTLPGTPEHLAQVDRLMGFEGGQKSGSECAAYVRLLSAAPEMYEALQMFLTYNDPGGPLYFDIDAMWAKARSVIAKIEGGGE